MSDLIDRLKNDDCYVDWCPCRKSRNEAADALERLESELELLRWESSKAFFRADDGSWTLVPPPMPEPPEAT